MGWLEVAFELRVSLKSAVKTGLAPKFWCQAEAGMTLATPRLAHHTRRFPPQAHPVTFFSRKTREAVEPSVALKQIRRPVISCNKHVNVKEPREGLHLWSCFSWYSSGAISSVTTLEDAHISSGVISCTNHPQR